MTKTTARGTFDVDGWEQDEPYDTAEGNSLARVRVTKTFRGDLVATSTADLLNVHTEAGPAAYVAVEHVTGALGGRKGTFVMQHSAGSEDGEQWLRLLIVPGTGTGELAGLRGEGTIEVAPDGAHSYAFDYEVG